MALIARSRLWAPVLATLAAITIVVGNVGALGQSSLKRMLAFSSVAQAGYMLAGRLVVHALGRRATVFYLAAYLADEPRGVRRHRRARARDADGDDIRRSTGSARDRRCWPGR